MMFRKSKTGSNPTPGRKARARGMRGSLMIVAALLLGSAMLRMGHDAGRVLALGQDAVEMSALEPSSPLAQCKTREDFQAMLVAFQEREAKIKSQEMAISDRLRALQIADDEIEGKLARLVDAEEKLRSTIALADTAASDDIDRLTRVYETMKPKQAAALFEEMSPEFAVGFLARMRPDAAAGIMAGLTPGAAHSFSVMLAGRNAEVPKN